MPAETRLVAQNIADRNPLTRFPAAEVAGMARDGIVPIQLTLFTQDCQGQGGERLGWRAYSEWGVRSEWLLCVRVRHTVGAAEDLAIRAHGYAQAGSIERFHDPAGDLVYELGLDLHGERWRNASYSFRIDWLAEVMIGKRIQGVRPTMRLWVGWGAEGY